MNNATFRICACLTIAAFAACTQPRTFTFVDGKPVLPFDLPVVAVDDRAQLETTIEGGEHRLTWVALADFPLADNDSGLMLQLLGEETLSLRLRAGERLVAPKKAMPAHARQLLRIERAMGRCTMNVAGSQASGMTRGTIDLQFDPAQMAILRDAGWNPTGNDGLKLLLEDTSADELVAFKNAAPELSLRLALALAHARVSRAQFAAFAAATDHDDDGVRTLLRHGVDLQVPIDWHAMGRDLTVEQVIYCKQRGFGPELAREWQDADTELSIEQIYWAQQRGLTPRLHTEWVDVGHRLSLEDLYWVHQRGVHAATCGEWRAAGLALGHEQLYWAHVRGLTAANWKQWRDAGKTLDLEQLYSARQYGLEPEASRAWREIGQDLTLDELREARQRGLRPAVAAEWRQLGYTWSIPELSKLRNFGISPQFARGFVDPRYENPGLAELTRYRQLGLDPEDVNKLRRPRQSVPSR